MVKPVTEIGAERESGKEQESGKKAWRSEAERESGKEQESGKKAWRSEAEQESGKKAWRSEAERGVAGGSSTHVFKLPMSKALARKVQQKAADEGVSPEELLCELVAEGLVLRAWEIMERKSTMRGGRAQNFNQKNRFREQKGRRGFNRGNRAEKGTALLEDRAAFLEYVRNQEKGNK